MDPTIWDLFKAIILGWTPTTDATTADYTTTDDYASVGLDADTPGHGSVVFVVKNTGATYNLDARIEGRIADPLGASNNSDWVPLNGTDAAVSALTPGSVDFVEAVNPGFDELRLAAKSSVSSNHTTVAAWRGTK